MSISPDLPETMADDRLLWDLHFSPLTFPAVTAALELKLFDMLAQRPLTAEDVAGRFGLNRRGANALLAVLAANGLLHARGGLYAPTEAAGRYLVSGSPHFWGPVFDLMRMMPVTHEGLMAVLTAPDEASALDSLQDMPSDSWTRGEMSDDEARMVTRYMNANSLLAADVAAQRLDAGGISRLLDVGGGSGCFIIAMLKAHAHMTGGILDLGPVCRAAREYVDAARLGDRITMEPRNMFNEDWPAGYDALFFSNIFHDWNFDTCRLLAEKAFQALPSGGTILLHEALLADGNDGPATTAAFSLYMLAGTKGQQFTLMELKGILEGAGFTGLSARPAHAYHFLVSARKP
jgi:acetylserotonin N-methyltransferase